MRNALSRREEVLLAARRCLAYEGLDHLTMRMIACEAGVSLGTVTYYFPSKEKLLTTLLFRVAEQFDNSMECSCQGETDPYQELLTFIANSLPANEPTRELWLVWLEFWNQASRKQELSPLHAKLYASWRHQVADLLSTGIDANQFYPHDTELVAKQLVAMIDGLAVNAVVGDPEISVDEMYRACRALIDSLLIS